MTAMRLSLRHGPAAAGRRFSTARWIPRPLSAPAPGVRACCFGQCRVFDHGTIAGGSNNPSRNRAASSRLTAVSISFSEIKPLATASGKTENALPPLIPALAWPGFVARRNGAIPPEEISQPALTAAAAASSGVATYYGVPPRCRRLRRRRKHKAVKTPLLAQQVGQQETGRAIRHAVQGAVGAHHRTDVAFAHGGFECRQIRFVKVAFGRFGVENVPLGFRPAVDGEMFRAGHEP